MKRSDLEKIIDSLFPRLYGFSSALTQDTDQASQTLVDAYTVFILREKNFIADMELNLENRAERVSAKRYFFNELLKEIFELAKMRRPDRKIDNSGFREYQNFYDLNLQRRAIIYLKDVEGLSIEDLQEVFVMQRHQVVELLHNSYYELVKDIRVEESPLEETL